MFIYFILLFYKERHIVHVESKIRWKDLPGKLLS